MINQCRRRHAANTNYWYCWTSIDVQKHTGTDSIYSGPDMVQNQYQAGASIPMGQGGHVLPNIYEGGDVHGNVSQYFRSDVVLMQILCVISQKSFSF